MTRMLVSGLLVLSAVSFAAIGIAQTADAPPQFKAVKITELPRGLTVVIETSGPPRYHASLIAAPARIVIDMNGTYAAAKARWVPTPEPIREIRGSQWKPGTARLVVELTRPVSYRIEEGATGLTLTLEPKAESPKLPERAADASKPDAAKSGPPAKDPPKDRTPKLDAAKHDTPKPDPSRPNAPEPAAPKALAKTESTAAAVLLPLPAAPPAAPSRLAQAAPSGSPPAQPGPGREAQLQTASNGSKLITLDFKDADVVNVLRLLATEGGRNIVVGDDVKGKVSVSLRNVTWEQALDTILEARGLQKAEKAGVIRIVSSEQLAKEREAQAKAEEAKRKAEIEVRTKMAEAQVKEQEAQQRRVAMEAAATEALARGPLKEEVLRLQYADAGEVGNTLQGVLGLGVQPILPCRLLQGAQGTGVSGGGVSSPISGPIAEPPFSQLFGPPRQPEAPPPAPVSPDVVANRLTIRTHCPTNSLFVRLFAANLDRVKTLIRDFLDVPLPQVKIEARMEILDRNALEAIGVQWGGGGVTNAGRATLVGQGFGQPNTGGGIPPSPSFTPSNPNLNLSSALPISPVTGLPAGANLVNLPIGALTNAAAAVPTAGLAFGIVGSQFNINLALQALNEMGKTQTLARPEIVTVENNKATIALGEEIPYATVSSAGTQIQFKEAVLKLEVTPSVIRERIGGREQTKIKMVILVENNDRGRETSLGINVFVPAINKRRAETLVLMNEGERLVIGGVTTAINENTVRKVPLWGDVPVLGWLFKAKADSGQARELVVFLTPSVLKSMVAAPALGK